jgi:hypothetical protein
VPCDSIVSYAWDLNNDGTDDLSSAAPATAVTAPWSLLEALGLSYPADPATGLPTNTVRLRVTDEFGLQGTTTVPLRIYGNQPLPRIAVTDPPSPPIHVDAAVTLDASGSSHGSPLRSIVRYEWDFDYNAGAGFTTAAEGVTATHAYATVGRRTVALRVTDDNDPPRTGIATTELNVRPEGEVYWVPDADGQWHVPSNWSSNPASPGPLDPVLIDVGGSTVRTITHSQGDDQVQSLWSEENLMLTGGSLRAGTMTVAGTTTVNGGMFDSTLLVTPVLTFAANAGNRLHGMTVQGRIDAAAAGATNRVTGGLVLDGTADITGNNACMIFEGSQTFGTTTGATVNLGSLAFLGIDLGGQLLLGPGVQVTGRGAVGQVVIAGPAGTLLNRGELLAGNGNTLTINPGTLVNEGTLRSNPGSHLIVMPGAGWSGPDGAVILDGGTLTLMGAFGTSALAHLTRNGGTLRLGGTLDNAGQTLNAGPLELNNGRVLGGAIVGNVSPGTSPNNRIEDVTSLTGNLDLSLTSRRLEVRGGLQLNGTATLGTQSILTFAGPQTLGSDSVGVVNLTQTSQLVVNGLGGDDTFTVGSPVTVQGAGAITSNGDIDVQGTLDANVAGQTLAITGPVTNNGAFSASNGGTLALLNGLTNLAGGVLTGGTWLVGPGSTIQTAGNPPVQQLDSVELRIQGPDARRYLTEALNRVLNSSVTVSGQASGDSSPVESLIIDFSTIRYEDSTIRIPIDPANPTGALEVGEDSQVEVESSSLIIDGTGNLRNAGSMDVGDSTVAAVAADNSGTLSLDSGALTMTSLQNSGTTVAAGVGLASNSSLALNTNGAALTNTGTIRTTGTGSLLVSGPSGLTLSGAGGRLDASGGPLRLDGSSGPVSVLEQTLTGAGGFSLTGRDSVRLGNILARTFVVPHTLEVSGRLTTPTDTFDTTLWITYTGGLGLPSPSDVGLGLLLAAGAAPDMLAVQGGLDLSRVTAPCSLLLRPTVPRAEVRLGEVLLPRDLSATIDIEVGDPNDIPGAYIDHTGQVRIDNSDPSVTVTTQNVILTAPTNVLLGIRYIHGTGLTVQANDTCEVPAGGSLDLAGPLVFSAKTLTNRGVVGVGNGGDVRTERFGTAAGSFTTVAGSSVTVTGAVALDGTGLTASANAHVGSLAVTGTQEFDASTVTVDGDATQGGTAIIRNGSTFQAGGRLEGAAGSTTQVTGSQLAAGALRLQAGAVFDCGAGTVTLGPGLPGGTVLVEGQMTFADGSTATVLVPATIDGDGTIRVSDSAAQFGAAVTINPGAGFQVDGGSSVNVDVGLGNGGTASIDGSQVNAGAVTNSGAATLANGASVTAAQVTNSGTVTATAGASTVTTGHVTNDGTLGVEGGTLDLLSPGAFLLDGSGTGLIEVRAPLGVASSGLLEVHRQTLRLDALSPDSRACFSAPPGAAVRFGPGVSAVGDSGTDGVGLEGFTVSSQTGGGPLEDATVCIYGASAGTAVRNNILVDVKGDAHVGNGGQVDMGPDSGLVISGALEVAEGAAVTVAEGAELAVDGPRVGLVGGRLRLAPGGLARCGDSGPTVAELQKALGGQPAGLEVDGEFGPETEAAVRQFQVMLGASPDGLVNPNALTGTGVVKAGQTESSGLVSPGRSAGILTLDGDYVQTSLGGLLIEVGGTAPGTQHDRLAVTGAARLAGALRVELPPGAAFAQGDTFDVVTAGTVTGTFGTVLLPASGSGSPLFAVEYLPGAVRLRALTAPDGTGALVVAAALPGPATGIGSAVVVVAGPTPVAESAVLTFAVEALGGTAPYHYDWRLDGAPAPGAADAATYAYAPGSAVVAHPAPRLDRALVCTVTDGAASRALATVTWQVVRVTDTDRPPPAPRVAIAPAEPRTADDLAVTILEQSPDPDGDAVSGYAVVWDAAGGPGGIAGSPLDDGQTRKGQTWQATVRALTDPYGEGAVASSEAGTATATIGNTPPQAVSQWGLTLAADTALAIQLQGSDPDVGEGVDTLSFSRAAGPTHGDLPEFDTASGAASYLPGTGHAGSDSFSFQVSDGAATSAEGSVDLYVYGGWVVTLKPAGSGRPLQLGVETDATPGIDALFDLEAGPAEPGVPRLVSLLAGAKAGVFSDLARDIRGLAPPPAWLLGVAPGADDLLVSWADSDPPPDSLWLWEVGTADPEAPPLAGTLTDMAATRELRVAAGPVRYYVVASVQVYALALAAGWNLISLPVEPEDPAVEAVLAAPDKAATVYSGYVWTADPLSRRPRYIPVREMHALTGYWLYAPNALVVNVFGQPAAVDELGLHPGWNLAAVPEEADLPADPAVLRPAWGWQGGAYRGVTRLEPGLAYWLLCTGHVVWDPAP